MLPGRLNEKVPRILANWILACPITYLIKASSWNSAQSGMVEKISNITACLGNSPWNLNFLVSLL
jgi:hypothetical protein